jgi:uncharacterized SAM-binding protein YcdF (DUF218 family)
MNLDAINELASFLALQDAAVPTDVGVLVGCSVLANATTIAEGYFAGHYPKIFVCGGIGHSTQDLRDLVQERFPGIETEGRAESEIFRSLLTEVHQVPNDVIEIEARSTNCGGNAKETRAELANLGWSVESLTLVQDPTMQRRTDATFRKVWEDQPKVRFVNRAPFVPKAIATDAGLDVEPQAWPFDRFLSLILGEIPRLRDDENGYGPRGRGYLVHVDIPHSVEAAFQTLSTHAEARKVV